MPACPPGPWLASEPFEAITADAPIAPPARPPTTNSAEPTRTAGTSGTRRFFLPVDGVADVGGWASAGPGVQGPRPAALPRSACGSREAADGPSLGPEPGCVRRAPG